MKAAKTSKPVCPIAEEHRQRYKWGPSRPGLADLCFYHWSPSARRKGILRSGFLPGSRSLQGDWRPPFTCFADDALLAWNLSGRLHPEVVEWDLWMCYPEDVERWEAIFDTYYDTGRHFIKEYRVYHRIFKRHVHYVASRTAATTTSE